MIACTPDSVPKVPVVSADWGVTPLDTGFADTVAAVFRVTLDTAGYGALLPEGYWWSTNDNDVKARARLECEAVAE